MNKEYYMKKTKVTILTVDKPTMTNHIYPRKTIEDWLTRITNENKGSDFFIGVIDKVLDEFAPIPIHSWIGIATNPRLVGNNLIVDITSFKKIDFAKNVFFTLGIGDTVMNHNSKQEIVNGFDLEYIVMKPIE